MRHRDLVLSPEYTKEAHDLVVALNSLLYIHPMPLRRMAEVLLSRSVKPGGVLIVERDDSVRFLSSLGMKPLAVIPSASPSTSAVPLLMRPHGPLPLLEQLGDEVVAFISGFLKSPA